MNDQHHTKSSEAETENKAQPISEFEALTAEAMKLYADIKAFDDKIDADTKARAALKKTLRGVEGQMVTINIAKKAGA